MKLSKSCPKCQKKVSFFDKMAFIFTWRYKCGCGEKYKVSAVSAIVLTAVGVVLAKIAEHLLNINFLVSIWIIVLALALMSIFALDLKKVERQQ